MADANLPESKRHLPEVWLRRHISPNCPPDIRRIVFDHLDVCDGDCRARLLTAKPLEKGELLKLLGEGVKIESR